MCLCVLVVIDCVMLSELLLCVLCVACSCVICLMCVRVVLMILCVMLYGLLLRLCLNVFRCVFA